MKTQTGGLPLHSIPSGARLALVICLLSAWGTSAQDLTANRALERSVIVERGPHHRAMIPKFGWGFGDHAASLRSMA